MIQQPQPAVKRQNPDGDCKHHFRRFFLATALHDITSVGWASAHLAPPSLGEVQWGKHNPIHESLPGVKQDFFFFHLLFFF
jgi:hypothetical protein